MTLERRLARLEHASAAGAAHYIVVERDDAALIHKAIMHHEAGGRTIGLHDTVIVVATGIGRGDDA